MYWLLYDLGQIVSISLVRILKVKNPSSTYLFHILVAVAGVFVLFVVFFHQRHGLKTLNGLFNMLLLETYSETGKMEGFLAYQMQQEIHVL